jgi:hypothetical protein
VAVVFGLAWVEDWPRPGVYASVRVRARGLATDIVASQEPIVSSFEFEFLTGRGAPMPPNVVDVYYGHSFQCACGSVYTLDANVPIPREIP